MAQDSTLRNTAEDQQSRRFAGIGAGLGTANAVSPGTPEARKTVHRTSQNLNAVMEAGAKLSEASQSIWREWLDYAQQAARQQTDGLQKIAAARSPHDLLDAQFALMRDEMRTFLDSAGRISAISSKAVRAAAEKMPEDDGQENGQTEHRQHRRA